MKAKRHVLKEGHKKGTYLTEAKGYVSKERYVLKVRKAKGYVSKGASGAPSEIP